MEPEANRGAFGHVLRRLRLQARMSQEELAERARLSVESISALERGRRKQPYRVTIHQLADAMGLTAAQRHELVAAAARSKPGQRAAITYDSTDAEEALSPGPSHNLPNSATTLLGRTRDLEQLGSLLAERRLVTVVGAGGVGKTRVALELARTHFQKTAQTTWFIDLAPLRDGELVASTVSTTIGAASRTDRPALESIKAHIGQASMLLVLDNCEHVIEQAGDFAGELLRSCGGVRLVATSREALQIDGEMAVRLPSLETPSEEQRLGDDAVSRFSALTLFLERAKACNSDIRITPAILNDIGRICRRLDGIPLAIELAAARTQTMSIGDLCRTLNDTFNILTDSPRRGSPRQQTIVAVIDWSYDLLSPAEQQLFVRLSIFAGGCTRDAAQAVCSDDAFAPGDIMPMLASLVRKSLVVAQTSDDGSRYRLLESTRSYARSKLAPPDLERLERRHAAWVADFTGTADRASFTWGRQRWLDVYSTEVDNIRAALKSSLDGAGDASVAARIAAAVVTFWFEAGLQAEGRAWIDKALDRLGTAADPAILGRLWWAAAVLNSGRKVVLACERAIALLSRVEDSRSLGNAYVHFAMGLWQVGRLAEAFDATCEALRLISESGMRQTLRFADILDLKANILLAQGAFEDARRTFVDAHELFRILADGYGAARTQGGLAELEFACGNVDAAIVLVDEAALTFERVGSKTRLATARVNAAAYRLTLGEVYAAGMDAVDGLELALRAQDKPLIAVAIQQIAFVLALRGRAKPAALLTGYVSAWYEGEGYQRERTEQLIYDKLMASLAETLAVDELDRLARHGAMLAESNAVEAARSNALDVLAAGAPTVRI